MRDIVSIPAGFSDALRPPSFLLKSGAIVSIPAGFSDALRRIREVNQGLDTVKFQSLLGFLMRCDERQITDPDISD